MNWDVIGTLYQDMKPSIKNENPHSFAITFFIDKTERKNNVSNKTQNLSVEIEMLFDVTSQHCIIDSALPAKHPLAFIMFSQMLNKPSKILLGPRAKGYH